MGNGDGCWLQIHGTIHLSKSYLSVFTFHHRIKLRKIGKVLFWSKTFIVCRTEPVCGTVSRQAEVTWYLKLKFENLESGNLRNDLTR